MTVKWEQEFLVEDVRNTVRGLCEEGAKRVRDDAKRLVPVKTGALRDSIKVKRSQFSSTDFVVQAYGDETGRNGKPKFYASFVETGLSAGNVRQYSSAGSVLTMRDQAPQPYLRPALHKNKNKIARMFHNPRLKNTKVLE